MKRVGYLYEKVMTADNIRAAYDAYNANRPVRLQHEYNPKEAAKILALMKSDFAACIGKARPKWYQDRDKKRLLEIPGSIYSSIAQLALWNVCGPYVERRIHDNSFSSRKGKGGHVCARKAKRFVRTKGREGARYCLYFDIRKYYQHIDKRIVMSRLEAIFKDRRVVELFRAVVYSTPVGLPIGYPFSHALANLYLVPLYYLICAEGKRQYKISRIFVYMDNWAVFARYKSALRKAVKTAVGWLARMGCAMKQDWQIFPTAKRAVRICGIAVKSGGECRLYKKLWHRTMRNFDRLIRFFKLSDFLGMNSRLGWLDLCGLRFCEAFKHEGGYLW